MNWLMIIFKSEDRSLSFPFHLLLSMGQYSMHMLHKMTTDNRMPCESLMNEIEWHVG